MAPTGLTFEALMDRRPDLREPYNVFVGLFWARRLVDPIVLELCRLRIAQLHGCEGELGLRTRAAVEHGLTEEQVARLSTWPAAAGFTDAQRAALALAEQFVIDPHGVDETMRAAVQGFMTFTEFVALTETLALFDGFMRIRLALCDESVAEPRVVDPPVAPSAALVVPADADPALAASVLGEQPETLTAFLRLYGTLWSRGTVEQPLKEIARLRNARITDCGY